MNVLVVDPSKVFQKLWAKMFVRLGHEPLMVESGEAAVQLVRRRDVDLVFTTLSLSGMNGIQLTHRLRSIPTCRDIPILMLTATEEADLKQRALAAGVTEIHDRTDVDALEVRLRTFMEEHARRVNGRVLYIEDSAVMAHAMLKILHGMKLEVDHFKNATEAHDAFLENDYDLVISDLLVEGKLSGFDLVSRIREMRDDKSHTPILAVSGMDDVSRRVELFRRGADDFISKPVVEEEVVARATNLITKKQLFDKVTAQQEHLYELAMVDQLTGLFTRNSLAEMAPRALAEARRHRWPVSLLVIDLDHFKKINDTHGHLVGDSVLAEVGTLLKGVCRPEDQAARFGGEEMILMMPHCELESAQNRAEFIRKKIEDLNPVDIPITVSIGVTWRPPGSRDVGFDELFQAADRAVYEAKEKGRNRVVTRLLEE